MDKCDKSGGKCLTLKGIAADSYRRFKVACDENDITIRGAILRFIEQYGSEEMWEMSDGENTAVFDNLFIGLDSMLFHAEGHGKSDGWVKIRRVK